MTMKQATQVGFIDLLYAMLLGVVVQRLEFAWSVDTMFRVLSVAVLLEDYLAYHFSTTIAPGTGRNYEIRLFVLDIAILLSWYFATMAIPGHYRWYLLGSAFFFATKTIWEHVAYGTRGLRLFTSSHAGLCLLYVALGVLQPAIGPWLAAWIAFAGWAAFTPWWWLRRSK